MSNRGRRKRERTSTQELAPLLGQNVQVNGRRTSMRLERSMWEAFEEIARIENMSINDICGKIEDRLSEQAARKGVPSEDFGVTLTAAVRAFIVQYFRAACTPTGHQEAGHGMGDPLATVKGFRGPSGDGEEEPGAPDGGSSPPDSTPPPFGSKESKSASLNPEIN